MHDEDQPTRRLHARRSPPDGDTPEANELAEWLRARVGGRSLRQLEGLFRSLPGPVTGPGRTHWNELLNGRKLIYPTLLDEIVKKLVPLREQRIYLKRGHELLRAAQDAARLAARSSDATSGMPGDYVTSMNDPLQGRRRVQATEQGIDGFIRVVLLVTTELSQECKDLRDERDRVLLRLQEVETTVNEQRAAENRKREAENQRLLDDVMERLAESEQQRAEFEERLNCAVQKKQEAEVLRAEASRQLTRGDASQGPGSEDPGFLPAPRPPEYKDFLELADAQLDIYTAELDAAREQIAGSLPPAPPGVRIVFGEVVPDLSTDSADTTPPASADPVPGLSADRPVNDSATRTKGFAVMPGNTGSPGRGNVPPTGGTARRNGAGLRTALVGAACLALLAGGGLLAWDQLKENSTKGSSGAPGPSVKSSSGTPGPSASPSPEKEDDSLNVLNEVIKGEGSFVIGVKDNQPGLSVYDGREWQGAEIEFAKLIAKGIGVPDGKVKFEPVGTGRREMKLNSGAVQMFIGSYGMRGRGDEVDFVGPYYQTEQKIMMRKANGKNAVEFRNTFGEQSSKTILSIDELKEDGGSDVPICTARESSSEKYLKGAGFNGVLPVVDYSECMSGLLEKDASGTYKYDGVTSDEVILEGLQRAHPDELEIVRDGFDRPEMYGIGLKKNSPALKARVCEAMKAVGKAGVRSLYGEISGAPGALNIPDSECF